MSNKFDKLINKKISETKLSPSSDLWDKIEASLDEKKNKKILILPLWSSTVFKQVIAASAIFLLGGLSAFYYMNSNSSHLEISKIKKHQSIHSTSNVNSENDIIPIASNEKNVKTTEKTLNNHSLKTNSLTIQSNNKKLPLSKNILLNTVTNHSVLNSFTKNKKNNTLAFKNNTSVKDYVWIYDNKTNTYQVILKENYLVIASNKNSIASFEAEKTNIDLPMMSLTKEEKEYKEEKEVVELKEEDDSYKQFRTKVQKLNYQGFWLGPNIGYKSLFIAGNHYAGGSFGIDFGYDFGGSFGIQTGLIYAINTKNIALENQLENNGEYRSEFNSLHIPLMMRYKITKMAKNYSKPLSFNLLAGADYSYMDRKKIHQLGFVAGAEYDIFTQADLMFTLGLRTGIYNNLNIKNINIPEKITPFSYSLDAYLSVRFIDWVKKRK